MSTKKIDVDLKLDVPQEYSVATCTITEGISELSHASVEIAARDQLELDRVLATEARLELFLDGESARRFTFRVAKVSFIGVTHGSLRYRVDLRALPWLLRHTQNTRKFRGMSTEEIISKVLGEHFVPFSFKTTRTSNTRNYCVQYHESNLDFVCRLLEFEGFYHTFDADGVWIFGDASSAEPEVAGDPHIELIDAAGALDRDKLGVHELERGAEVASGTATVNDYNWKKPRVPLIQTASAANDAELEIYDYPTGYRTPDEGALLARLRLEALRVPADFLEGKGNVPSFAPARVFFMGGEAGSIFEGEWLLVRVKHEITMPGYGKEVAEAGSYVNSFHAIPRAVPFRAPLRTPSPAVAGNHTVMVRGPAGEEIHTDEHGRFKAQFHWDREAQGTDEDSRWIRMTQEVATSMTLARVGWEVSVGYINGDPDRPIGLSRQINGVMPPVYGQPAKKNVMTIKTPTYPGGGGYNEWRMDDSAGSMAIDVRAQREFLLKTQNDKSETVGNDETHANAASFTHGVDRHQKVQIGADSTTTVVAEEHLLVGSNRTVSVGGSETIKIADAHESRVEANDLEIVGSVRLTIAGKLQVNLPNPKDVLKDLIPTPQAIVQAAAGGALTGAGGSVGGVIGGALSGAGGAVSSGKDVGQGALGGALGAAGGQVGGVIGAGLEGAGRGISSGGGASGAIRGAAEAAGKVVAQGAGPLLSSGQLGQLAQNPVAAAQSAVSNVARSTTANLGNVGNLASGLGNLSQNMGNVAQGAVAGATESLKSMIPQPQAIADKLTGGLASGITLDKLLDNFTVGSIDRQADENMRRTVGGAYIELALGNIDTRTGEVYLEAAGGAKVTVAATGGIGQTVDGYHTVTVGGVMMRKANKDISYSAKKTTVNVGVALTLRSDERIELKSKKILLDGKEKVSFSVDGGKLLIELTPSGVKLKGKVAMNGGDKILVTAGKDLLT